MDRNPYVGMREVLNPERIASMRFGPDGVVGPNTVFEVGVIHRTHDNSGCALAPNYHEVKFGVNDAWIGLHPKHARELVTKILQYCDEADRLNKEGSNG